MQSETVVSFKHYNSVENRHDEKQNKGVEQQCFAKACRP